MGKRVYFFYFFGRRAGEGRDGKKSGRERGVGERGFCLSFLGEESWVKRKI